MHFTSSHKQIFDKGLMDEKQFNQLELIKSGKLISLFYELRTLLYLGIMLFSTGVGILIYENIGSLGHIIAVLFISVISLLCFVYSFKNQSGFSKLKVNEPTPYFDYVLLLGCLLFVTLFGYIQFLYGVFDDYFESLTLITAVFFFFIAYRLDHVGVLSLAITALASFWGLSISPQKWYSGSFFDTANLHYISIVFGLLLSVVALILDRKKIKQHFTFSYINISCLLFFVGTTAAIFYEDFEALFIPLQIVGAIVITYYSIRIKSFLFALYGFIFGYIAFTYFITMIIPNGFEVLWAYYLLFSCGLFVFLIIRYRKYFKRED